MSATPLTNEEVLLSELRTALSNISINADSVNLNTDTVETLISTLSAKITACNTGAVVIASGTITTVGAVTAISNALPAGTNAIGKLSPNSGVTIGDVNVVSDTKAATATITSVAGSTLNTNVLTSSATRLKFKIYNNASTNMYVKEGTTASTSSFSYIINPQGYYEGTTYTGNIDAVWGTGVSGSALVTVLTL